MSSALLPRRRPLLVLLFGLSLCTVGLIGRAAPASAHAVVVSASPADGARLATAPTSVSVTFDETVGLSGIGYLQVVDGYGNRVDSGAATQTGATIKVAHCDPVSATGPTCRATGSSPPTRTRSPARYASWSAMARCRRQSRRPARPTA